MRRPERDPEGEATAAILFIILILVLWLASCSASDVKGTIHKVGTPATATSAAMLASGGNPVVGGAVLVGTVGAELFIPNGKEDAIRETVEALSKDDALSLFAGKEEMTQATSSTRWLAFLLLFGSVGYTYWRRRKAQGKYDLLDELKAELDKLKK